MPAPNGQSKITTASSHFNSISIAIYLQKKKVARIVTISGIIHKIEEKLHMGSCDNKENDRHKKAEEHKKDGEHKEGMMEKIKDKVTGEHGEKSNEHRDKDHKEKKEKKKKKKEEEEKKHGDGHHDGYSNSSIDSD